ncbi:MAG: hypothetical protein KGM43_13300 [Planctomycetota bacterium]|nr:hypothetical protein [Planctomycetota bacterium]
MIATTSDIAAARALRAFSGAGEDRLRGRFEADWAARLEPPAATVDPETARAALRAEHAAQARPDLARVHPSWLVRALREESPAVVRAVLSRLDEPLRSNLRVGLGLAADDLACDRTPHEGAVATARCLWTERLVGDVPTRDDDPRVIVAMTALDPRALVRVIRTAGLAKFALALPREADAASFQADHYRQSLLSSHPSFVPQALRDVAELPGGPRHRFARLGTVTFARLLACCEPYRARWALQHWPYASAKWLRMLMGRRTRPGAALADFEAEVLRLAIDPDATRDTTS